MFTIKPLEWVDDCAISILGTYYVWKSTKGWRWQCRKQSTFEVCESLDDGKSKAEAHYRERLMQALAPAPDVVEAAREALDALTDCADHGKTRNAIAKLTAALEGK
jgi:hypothetical protein